MTIQKDNFFYKNNIEKKIKKIINIMNKNFIKKIKFKNRDFSIEIYKNEEFKLGLEKRDDVNKFIKNIKVIKSPISGIFYTSSSPGKPSFVNKGDFVKIGDVLCIIEASKNLHQIKSDVSGTIFKIIPENKKKVEYNEDLFLIKYV